MRLDKFIANNSGYSRSDVKKLLKNNAITINGELASAVDQKVSVFADDVLVNGQPVCLQSAQYYMLHKPVNVVCANSHPDYPTVIDLLGEIKPEQRHKLQIAGRLDVDTTGLVLLTDDGQWNHKVTTPRSDCVKVYEVELEQPFDEKFIGDFEQGMLLEGENKLTLPAQITVIDNYNVRLGICEGRYHQVKRMFLFANNRVRKLHRASIGSLALDPALEPGAYRALTAEEVAQLAGNAHKEDAHAN